MASSFTPFSSILIFTTLLTSAIAIETKTHPQQPFKKIYAFGDSYTDTGNTASATGPTSFSYVSNLPYGCTFFHRPTNRYSDGRLVIDFVSQALSLPYLPPYRDEKADRSSGVNFAVAGSTAIRHKFFVKNNLSLDITPESLQTQLTWFNKFLESHGCVGNGTSDKCRAVFDDALVWVGEIGVNDYAYSSGSTVSGSTIQRLAIRSVTGFLEVLLTKGAKYVVVEGLPTSGCLPLAMVLSPPDDRDEIGCVGSVNKQSYNHNTILQSKLQQLQKQFPSALIVYADYYNIYHSVMKNPRKYGFTDAFEACCGSGGPYNFDFFAACGSPSSSSCDHPSQYVNWDGVHLTEAMYKVVSDSFLNGAYTHPPFSTLLGKKHKSG